MISRRTSLLSISLVGLTDIGAWISRAFSDADFRDRNPRNYRLQKGARL